MGVTAPSLDRLPLLQRASAAWLGIAVTLTTASQLRGGAPVGPGELMLLLWIGGATLSLLAHGRLRFTAPGRALGAFWTVTFALLLAGWVVGLVTGRASSAAARDFVAYLLVATMTALLTLCTRSDALARSIRVSTGFASVALAALLVLGLVAPGGIGPVDPWFFFRYRGWSENPNQAALAMCATPFLAGHLLSQATRFRERVWYLMVLGAAAAVGLATRSDGLVLGWAGGIAVAFAAWWLAGLGRGRFSWLRGATWYVIVPIVAAGALVAGGFTFATRAAAAFEQVYAAGDQGSIRLMLWDNALRATATSPLVGLGPGGHSGWAGPFREMEAHNMFVDWVSFTGFLGGATLLVLLAWAGWRARHTPALLGALIALFVFGLTGFHLRHPLFWLVFLYIVHAPESASREAAEAGPDQDAGRFAAQRSTQ